MSDLRVTNWPITRPIPYSRNARKVPPKAIEKVAASLQEFGFRQPIVVDCRSRKLRIRPLMPVTSMPDTRLDSQRRI